LRRIDHVGIIVDNLGEAKAFATQVLGFEFQREFQLPEQSVLAAFFTLGDFRLEFVEVTDAKLRRERLGDGAKARIEHIAFEVDDLDGTMSALRDKGVTMTTPEPWIAGTNRNIFTTDATTDGVRYQFFEKLSEK
jgi:catechol 2,3-dioxygenase-like lactoylglutathione lyase family enzyme